MHANIRVPGSHTNSHRAKEELDWGQNKAQRRDSGGLSQQQQSSMLDHGQVVTAHYEMAYDKKKSNQAEVWSDLAYCRYGRNTARYAS